MAIIRDNTTIANTLKIENDGSIDTNLRLSGTSVTVGQKIGANSLGVVLASDTTLPLPTGAAIETGGNLSAISATAGAVTDSAYSGTGNSTIIGVLKGIYLAIKGVLTVTAPVGSPVDHSGTISVGGTSQLLMAASSTRYTLFISNPDPMNDLWVAINGLTALANGAGSVRVPSNGGVLGLKLPDPVRTSVSIVGAVTGQKFTSWEA